MNDPVDAFVFDCDGTLSLIEGIEVLAEYNGVGERVRELTEYAMSEAGINSDLYRERLDLVRPTRQQTMAVAQQYFAARVPKIVDVIEALQYLNKEVYVVSAGVNPAVTLFAAMLGVDAKHVYAVDLEFSPTGDYIGYDESAPPAQKDGKRIIAQELKSRHQNLVWIGDGMNDLVVKPDIQRFVGFGGAFYRPKIAAASDFYIKCQSMTPLLSLGLTASEVNGLQGSALALFNEGQQLIATGQVEINCLSTPH